MLFFYLYLAHLLSDYVFQPVRLVEWKHQSNWGIFTHALVHFLITTLLVFLYTVSYWSVLLGFFMAATHYFIDVQKISHEKKHSHTHFAYWIDQLCHSLVILFVSLVIYHIPGLFLANQSEWGTYFNALYFSPIFVTYSCLAIFSTLAIEYSYVRVKQNRSKKQPPLSARHMLKRLFLFTLVYVGLLFSLVPSVGFYF